MFGEILKVLTSEDHLKEKWFNFGYELGLTVGRLDDIETRYHDPLQRTRKVLLQWRVNNLTASWEAIAEALSNIDLIDLTVHVKHSFADPPEPQSLEEIDGVYCQLCDMYYYVLITHHDDIPGKLFIHIYLSIYLYYISKFNLPINLSH